MAQQQQDGVGRRYLFYSLISALVGIGISYLMTLGEGGVDVARQLAAGAVIGVTINTVIFALELTIVQVLERRTRIPHLVLRIPQYALGGMLGFLAGQRVAVLVFPSLQLMPSSALRAWLPFMGIFALVVGLLIYAYEGMRQRLASSFERIKEQELAEKELELAREMQERLLPARQLEGEGFAVAARNEPARFVAGDYYDIFRLPGGDLGLVVADVAGKGMAASLVMASTKAILPFLAKESGVADTLRSLNERLVRELGPREFVALCFARYAVSEHRLEIANAGLPDPYRVGRDGRVEALEVSGDRLPLGVRGDVRYASRTWTLAPGDRVLLHTDGFAEALRADGAPLGYDRLAALLPRTDLPPREWLDALFESLRAETEPERTDDWTALVLAVE